MRSEIPNRKLTIPEAVLFIIVLAALVSIVIFVSGCMSAELEDALRLAEEAESDAEQIREEEGRARQDAISRIDAAIAQGRQIAAQIAEVDDEKAIPIAIEAAGLIANLEQLRTDLIAQDRWSREAWTQQQSSIQTLMESLNQLIVRAKTFEAAGGLIGLPTNDATTPARQDSTGPSGMTFAGVGAGLIGLGGAYFGGRRAVRAIGGGLRSTRDGLVSGFRTHVLPRLPPMRRRVIDEEIEASRIPAEPESGQRGPEEANGKEGV